MEGEICETRYCDTGTIIIQDSTTVDVLRNIEKYKMSEKNVPRRMDPIDLRREHINRRAYTKPIVAEGNDLRKEAKNPHISQMQLQILMQRLMNTGVQYRSISQYFESVLKKSSLAGPVRSIIGDVLVKDRDQLKNSDACYQQVISDLQRGRLHGFESLQEAVIDLRSVLSSDGGR